MFPSEYERFKISFELTADPDDLDFERFDEALSMFLAVLAPNAPSIPVEGKFASRLHRVA